MNARVNLQTDLGGRTTAEPFLFASASEANARWMSRALAAVGRVEAVALDPALVTRRMSQQLPALLLVDFSNGNAAGASAVVAAAHAAFAGLQVIAAGRLAEPESALAALRSGVRDFVDVTGDSIDAARIVRQVLDNRIEPVSRHGGVTALVGARVGMGVTTLAANLGVLLSRESAGHKRQAALLDLGLPAGDGALLLNVNNGFGFVDAVRNLHRFDQTFVHTAFGRHKSGLALLTLPPDLGALREVSHQSAVALLARLRAFFDHQLVDLDGFTNTSFIAQVAQSADRVWLVCDQNVASIVSAVRELEALQEGGVDLANVRLVVNRHEPGLDLTAAQVAQRLQIELAGVVPERHVALSQAANRGELLVDTAPRDPYVRALETLAEQLHGPFGHAPKKLDALRRFLPQSSKRS